MAAHMNKSRRGRLIAAGGLFDKFPAPSAQARLGPC